MPHTQSPNTDRIMDSLEAILDQLLELSESSNFSILGRASLMNSIVRTLSDSNDASSARTGRLWQRLARAASNPLRRDITKALLSAGLAHGPSTRETARDVLIAMAKGCPDDIKAAVSRYRLHDDLTDSVEDILPLVIRRSPETAVWILETTMWPSRRSKRVARVITEEVVHLAARKADLKLLSAILTDFPGAAHLTPEARQALEAAEEEALATEARQQLEKRWREEDALRRRELEDQVEAAKKTAKNRRNHRIRELVCQLRSLNGNERLSRLTELEHPQVGSLPPDLASFDDSQLDAAEPHVLQSLSKRLAHVSKQKEWRRLGQRLLARTESRITELSSEREYTGAT